MRALYSIGIILLLVGCSVHGSDKESNQVQAVSELGQKISLKQAQEQIQELLAMFNYVEGIAENTTDEIWDKLGGQVFTIEVTGGTTITIWMKGEKVVPLGGGWDSVGPSSFCTSDLDQDGIYELLYMCSFGAGFSRTSLLGVEEDVIVDGGYVFEFNEKYAFKKSDDQEVLIMKGESVIGELSLDEVGSRKVLRVSE